jgi:hypothetical protein
MRRLFKFLYAIVFLSSFVVADDAGGTGELNIDDGAGEGNPTPTPTPELTPPAVENKDDERYKELEAKLKEQDEFITAAKGKEAVATAITDIKARLDGFDEAAVYEHLKKLNETDPAKAALLNNPLGWENVWYQIRPATVNNDNFSRGRNVASVNRNDEVFDLVKSGGATLADEVDVVGRML